MHTVKYHVLYMCVCMICQHYIKVNFRNLLAEASQNFTDPSAWLKKI